MPNLTPPITTLQLAKEYRERILFAPHGNDFEPLMTLYLTDSTPAHEIKIAKESGVVHGVKLYPAGATTNSQNGVTDIRKRYPIFEAMQKTGLPLLVHGEVTNPDIDIFDREKVFIDRILKEIIQNFPELKVVLEHITTKDAAQFVLEAPKKVAATITAHHLLLNRNDLLVGGIKPHYYCLPVLKRRLHQEALLQFATSGSSKVFLGTDSAPHAKNAKESCCGSAGCYTAYSAIELYAEAFDKANALDKLEAFASLNGPAFYNLPPNQEKITLKQNQTTIPDLFPFGEDELRPFWAGESLRWEIS